MNGVPPEPLLGPFDLSWSTWFSLYGLFSIIFSGVRLCGNRRTNYYLHLAWAVIYAVAGATQFIAGIYFMLEMPIFQLGSNIWTGAWVS